MNDYEIIKQMKMKAVDILLESENYSNYKLEYILANKDDETRAIAVASHHDEIAQIDLSTNEISQIPDWDYNIDEYIFNELENGSVIKYMSRDCHYGIWASVEQWYPEDIEHKKGMQEYLKYCKKNKVTKKEIKYDGENIMNYLKPKNKERGR